MGWARAQLVYDKLDRPPPIGSLLELVCLVVQRERANLRLLGDRAKAQAALGGEPAEQAFKEYAEAFSRVEKNDDRKKMAEQLEKLKEIKEIRFQPLVSTQRKVNLPVVEVQELKDRGVLQNLPTREAPQRARAQRKTR